jgi:hypothetical protein
MGGKFSSFERFLIGVVVVMVVWHFYPARVAPPVTKAPIAESEPSKPFANEVSSASILSKDPVPGTPMISRDGDPCTVASITDDLKPKRYRPGYTLKLSKLNCVGKKHHYVLNNIGVYKQGKLVSTVRKKIEDGHCHLLSSSKTALPGNKKAELQFLVLSCNKDGKRVWEEIARFYGNKKLISTQVAFRDPSSVKPKK